MSLNSSEMSLCINTKFRFMVSGRFLLSIVQKIHIYLQNIESFKDTSTSVLFLAVEIAARAQGLLSTAVVIINWRRRDLSKVKESSRAFSLTGPELQVFAEGAYLVSVHCLHWTTRLRLISPSTVLTLLLIARSASHSANIEVDADISCLWISVKNCAETL